MTRWPVTADLRRLQRRTVRVLVTAQLLSGLGQSAAVAGEPVKFSVYVGAGGCVLIVARIGVGHPVVLGRTMNGWDNTKRRPTSQ